MHTRRRTIVSPNLLSLAYKKYWVKLSLMQSETPNLCLTPLQQGPNVFFHSHKEWGQMCHYDLCWLFRTTYHVTLWIYCLSYNRHPAALHNETVFWGKPITVACEAHVFYSQQGQKEKESDITARAVVLRVWQEGFGEMNPSMVLNLFLVTSPRTCSFCS